MLICSTFAAACSYTAEPINTQDIEVSLITTNNDINISVYEITNTETTVVENSKEIIPFNYENDTTENNYSLYTNMNDEIKTLLKQAENLYYNYFLNVNETTFDWEKVITISLTTKLNGWEPYNYDEDYSLTGISYDSFKEALLQVFTEEFTENDLLKRNIYKNHNGELCYYPYFGYVRDTCFDNIIFSVSSQTENKITIIGTAYYSDPDDSSVTWENILKYDIVLTENGWRVNSFENWD